MFKIVELSLKENKMQYYNNMLYTYMHTYTCIYNYFIIILYYLLVIIIIVILNNYLKRTSIIIKKRKILKTAYSIVYLFI